MRRASGDIVALRRRMGSVRRGVSRDGGRALRPNAGAGTPVRFDLGFESKRSEHRHHHRCEPLRTGKTIGWRSARAARAISIGSAREEVPLSRGVCFPIPWQYRLVRDALVAAAPDRVRTDGVGARSTNELGSTDGPT